MENFWQTCSAQLEQELTPQQFSAWIKPLTPLDFDDGVLRIAAPNRFKLDWVKTQFAFWIQNSMRRAAQTRLRLLAI
jgi:chromosomal replication initiator protein